MITKEQLGAKILDLLEGGKHIRSESKYDIRYIMSLADSVYGSLVVKSYYETYPIDGELNESFLSMFTATVKQDIIRDVLYSDLPAKLVSIPNGSGLKSVSWQKDERSSFVHMKTESLSAWSELESTSLMGDYGFYLEGDRIIYHNMIDEDEGKTVKIRMVASLSSLDEDVAIPLPLDFEAPLIQAVVEMYSIKAQIPEDLINDNV